MHDGRIHYQSIREPIKLAFSDSLIKRNCKGSYGRNFSSFYFCTSPRKVYDKITADCNAATAQ